MFYTFFLPPIVEKVFFNFNFEEKSKLKSIRTIEESTLYI